MEVQKPNLLVLPWKLMVWNSFFEIRAFKKLDLQSDMMMSLVLCIKINFKPFSEIHHDCTRFVTYFGLYIIELLYHRKGKIIDSGNISCGLFLWFSWGNLMDLGNISASMKLFKPGFNFSKSNHILVVMRNVKDRILIDLIDSNTD